VRGQFCGPCLRNRYGEEVQDALLNPVGSQADTIVNSTIVHGARVECDSSRSRRSGSARRAEGSATAASAVPEKAAAPQGCWFTWLSTTAMITCTLT